MRALLTILFLSISLAAQTRSDLEKKYSSIGENVFRLKPGIAVEVTFLESGKVSTLKIFPEDRHNLKVRLNIDEVRSAIRELAPRLICFRARSSKEIKISCPPKNDCKGIKEEWARGTTLMVSDGSRGILYNMITLGDHVTPPPGNMKLLSGYHHVDGCGIDTATGTIEKENGLSIRYDIGFLTDNFAARLIKRGGIKWFRDEKAGDASVLVVLTNENEIIASFGKEQANFRAKVPDQTAIDEFLKIVLTYRGTVISKGR